MVRRQVDRDAVGQHDLRRAAAARGGARRRRGDAERGDLCEEWLGERVIEEGGLDKLDALDVCPRLGVERNVEWRLNGQRERLGAGHPAVAQLPPVAIAERPRAREHEAAAQRRRERERVPNHHSCDVLHHHVRRRRVGPALGIVGRGGARRRHKVLRVVARPAVRAVGFAEEARRAVGDPRDVSALAAPHGGREGDALEELLDERLHAVDGDKGAARVVRGVALLPQRAGAHPPAFAVVATHRVRHVDVDRRDAARLVQPREEVGVTLQEALHWQQPERHAAAPHPVRPAVRRHRLPAHPQVVRLARAPAVVVAGRQRH